ncbi:hypothetical protein B0H14DRAFT_3880758 [Mycena olivaceomarginata]|nr:hypothetical protein B0H14DRAFT_3880758 [Mycena olivaceomarginata]
MREILGVAFECPAYPPSVHPVRSSQNQERVSSHPRRSLAALPSVRQSGASSDAPDAFSTVSMLHTTCAAISSAARCPGGHLQHHDSARDPLQARSTVSCYPHGLDTTPARTQAQPHYQPHAQHATLACLTADDASSPSRTPTTFIASCVRSACDGRSPSPAPLLSPPRAPNAFPASTTLPDPHARRALHARPLACPAPAAAAPHPPRHGYHLSARRYRVQRLIILRSRPAHVRHLFPVAHAAFIASPGTAPIFCADASDRSKPWPAAHREQDRYHLPCAAHAAVVPPSPHTLRASHVHPQPYTAPLVDDSARRLPITSAGCVCRDDGATGWHGTDHTEAMRTPYFHRYPPSALGISDKRGWAPRPFLVQRTPAETAKPTLPRLSDAIDSNALDKIELTFDTLDLITQDWPVQPLADESSSAIKTWPSLIPSLAQKSKTLTKLYLRERISFHDTPDALDRMLPGDWFHPLLSCANLTEVVILTASGIDIEDAFLKRMATAWPQLRTLDLSPGCQSAAGHSLALVLDATRTDPEIFRDGISNCALARLDVVESSLSSPGAFLAAIFPNLQVVSSRQEGNRNKLAPGER